MNSEKIDESSFKILDDDEYLELSEFPLHLFEFWHGDIVEPKLYKLSDGRIDQVASKLLLDSLKFNKSRLTHTEKKLNE